LKYSIVIYVITAPNRCGQTNGRKDSQADRQHTVA